VTPATIQVTAAANPKEREVVQLAPHTTKALDLDLMAGPSYSGSYQLSYSGTLSAAGVSDQAISRAVSPAPTWFVPAAPQSISLTNTSGAPVKAAILAYGVNGVLRARQELQLAPHLSQTWTLPPAVQTMRLALAVQASAPVALSDPASSTSTQISQPQPTWYAVLPSNPRLAIFNPSSSVSSQVEIHFVGARVVRSLQLELPPHHSFGVPTHGARALLVSASNPVTAGYEGSKSLAPPLSATPSAETSFAAGGALKRVAVLNPSQQPAHLSLALQRPGGNVVKTAVVPPMHVSTLSLGQAPVQGVMVTSDVPVVAGPSS
jgi:hypothetical protein